MMNDLWKRYAADFKALTDAEIEDECERFQTEIDEATDWLEAVASWKAAGKPRGASHDADA